MGNYGGSMYWTSNWFCHRYIYKHMTAIDSPRATYNNLSRVFRFLRDRNHQASLHRMFMYRPRGSGEDNTPETRDFFIMESSIDFFAVKFPNNR